MNKHSPLPWKTPLPNDAEIVDANGYDVAAISGIYDIAYEEMEANAAHIVRCVNSHDDLVKALEAMTDRWEPDCIGTDRIMWENALAALEKAKAGA